MLNEDEMFGGLSSVHAVGPSPAHEVLLAFIVLTPIVMCDGREVCLATRQHAQVKWTTLCTAVELLARLLQCLVWLLLRLFSILFLPTFCIVALLYLAIFHNVSHTDTPSPADFHGFPKPSHSNYLHRQDVLVWCVLDGREMPPESSLEEPSLNRYSLCSPISYLFYAGKRERWWKWFIHLGDIQTHSIHNTS